MQFVALFALFFVLIASKMISGQSYSEAALYAARAASGSRFLMAESAASAALSGAWCLILHLRGHCRPERGAAFSLKNFAAAAGAGVGGCVTFTVFLSALMGLMPGAFEKYNGLMQNFDASGGALTLIYVVAIGPISEELIFRGAIFDRLHAAFPFWIANLMQALLFGIYHMNIIQGAYAFILGMLFGMAVYSSGSVILSIVAHVVFNSTSYAVQYIFGSASEGMGAAFAIFAAISFFLLVFSVKYYIMRCNDKCAKEGRIGGE